MSIAIKDIFASQRLSIKPLDLELILAHELKKPREFVLSHPEYKLSKHQVSGIRYYVSRREKYEPLAYILGEKEFYGLKFRVNKNVLIPRPETEILVDKTLGFIKTLKHKNIKTILVDVGTGSGNIIISIAKQLLFNCHFRETCPRLRSGGGNPVKLKDGFSGFRVKRGMILLATDISQKALTVAKRNAQLHKVDKKIKFLRGNLLRPVIKIIKNKAVAKSCDSKNYRLPADHNKEELSIIFLANLPYLSPKTYKNTPETVKNYEPKKALLSLKSGLYYYNRLLKQISLLKNNCFAFYVSCFMEISPEQKPALRKLIKKYFPEAEIKFYKDLAGKWRVCKLEIPNPKSKYPTKSQVQNPKN